MDIKDIAEKKYPYVDSLNNPEGYLETTQQQMCDEETHGQREGFVDGYNYALEKDPWISIEERLPEEDEMVEFTDGENQWIGEYTGDWWREKQEYIMIDDVTFWKELSNPPTK